jgi:hypothetical protein
MSMISNHEFALLKAANNFVGNQDINEGVTPASFTGEGSGLINIMPSTCRLATPAST